MLNLIFIFFQYSTRDDSSSSLPAADVKTPRFSSINTSSYRPSFSSSSGTYRSPRTNITTSPTPVTPYVSRYASLSTDKEKEKEKVKEKESSPPKKVQQRYGSNKDLAGSSTKYGSSKDLSATADAKQKYSTISGYGSKKKEKEEGPPITFNTRYKVTSSKGHSRDPSPSEPAPPTQTALQRITAARDRSRDPSPAAGKTNLTYANRMSNTRDKSPSPAYGRSPSTSSYSRLTTKDRARDPSPVIRSYTNTLTSVKDKARDPSPITRTYSNTLSSLTAKDKSKEPVPITRSYSNLKDKTKEPVIARSYSSSITNSREKSRDPSPAGTPRRPSISLSYPRSRDPSPAEPKTAISAYSRISSAREKARDASPIESKRTSSITLNKSRLRDSSPSGSYRHTSRDPSPAMDKFGSASSGYLSNNTASSNYTSKYGNTPTIASTIQPKSPNMSISYMSSNEASTRQPRIRTRQLLSPIEPSSSLKSPRQVASPVPIKEKPPVKVESSSETETSSSEETDDDAEELEQAPKRPQIMIQVTTITRSTSPTHPSASTSYLRSRRGEMTKTLEKVRARPLVGPQSEDKGTQSDRMDDTTRYSRFGSASRTNAFAPYLDSKYSPSPTGSYSSKYSGSRYSRETSVTSPRSDKIDSKPPLENDLGDSSEISESRSDKFNFSLPKSKESSPSKSISKISTSKSSSLSARVIAAAAAARDKIKSPTKSKTPDSAKSVPTQNSLKIETPVRTLSAPVSATTNGVLKIANKDFRKSALNMGPTDRPSKSKSSSGDSSSESPAVDKITSPFEKISKKSLDRQSSVTSEASTTSTETDSQVQQDQANIDVSGILPINDSNQLADAKSFLIKKLGSTSCMLRNYIDSPVEDDSRSTPISETFNQTHENTATILNNTNGFETETSNYYPNPTTNTTPEFPYRLRNFESGERLWWMQEDDTVNDVNNLENDITKTGEYCSQTDAIHEDNSKTIMNGLADLSVSSGKSAEKPVRSINNGSPIKTWWAPETSEPSNKILERIQRIQSGEKPWWFGSNSKSSSGDKNTVFSNNDANKMLNTMWELETQADVSELQKDEEISELNIRENSNLLKFPSDNKYEEIKLLGDRASPEGLEDSPGRKSPYDNIPSPIYNQNHRKETNFNAVPKMFISRHTNIDDLLGKSCNFLPHNICNDPVLIFRCIKRFQSSRREVR